MNPFDHVCIGDVEFILHQRCDAKSSNDVKWKAFDMNLMPVTISESDCTLLPSQCTRDGEWIHKPVFFFEKYVDGKWIRHELDDKNVSKDVCEGLCEGSFVDANGVWKWNIDTMRSYNGSGEWFIRVMTTGGVWI